MMKMSRQPLKKLNNSELKVEIVKGNIAKGEIISKQKEAYRKLTKMNKRIYATVKTIQVKLLPPPNAVTKHSKMHFNELPWKKEYNTKLKSFDERSQYLRKRYNHN